MKSPVIEQARTATKKIAEPIEVLLPRVLKQMAEKMPDAVSDSLAGAKQAVYPKKQAGWKRFMKSRKAIIMASAFMASIALLRKSKPQK